MRISNHPAVINIVQDHMIPINIALNNRYISNFSASLSGISIKKSKFSSLLDTLRTKYKIKEEVYKITKTNETFYIHEESNAFFIIGSLDSLDEYTFDVYSESYELNFFLYNLIKDFIIVETDVVVLFNMAYLGYDGIDTKLSVIARKEVEDIDNDYYPYIDIEEMFNQFSSFEENILILLGVPGTGKSKMATSYMKYLIQNEQLLLDENEDYSVVYAKDDDVISSDQFWQFLSKQEHDLVVFDDLDYFLGDRGDSVESSTDVKKNKFISNLLSFTDGVKKNRTKIIISTNKSIDGIDKAILRKGRLFDIIELRKLHNEEALNIWEKNNLSKKDFCFQGDVLQADLGSEISKNLKSNSCIKKYIKEEGLSKIESLKVHKKIGI